MSADEIIAILAEKGHFNARRLDFDFPGEVLLLASVRARAFFRMLSDEPDRISLDDLLNENWRRNDQTLASYRALDAEERLEVHAIIGYVLHETTHKVDLLISPFGLQYHHLLVSEYRILQNYLPRALDHPAYLSALRILPKLTEPPAGIVADGELRAIWDQLTTVVRKTMAWGDLGSLRPETAQISPGWDKVFTQVGDFFQSGVDIEPVKVLNSFYSFRPRGKTNWYLRPMTIFEAKALANTLLNILELSDSVADVALYYRRTYLDHADRLEPDYLFLLDTLAQIHGPRSFADALDSGHKVRVRHLLVMASALGWFALQAPPAVQSGNASISPVGANPVLRLFAALHHLPDVLKAKDGASTAAQLLMSLEGLRLFKELEQPTIAAALAASREALRFLSADVEFIWNPEVRDRFNQILKIMEPNFNDRKDTYISFLGMPDNGNPRAFVKSQAEMEPFYNDHAPGGAYADWLDMRGAVLFAHSPLSKAEVSRLDRHFMALLALAPCDCRVGFHPIWASRFATQFPFLCPVTGQQQSIDMENATKIHFPGDRAGDAGSNRRT